jgi:alpha-tubulin suppressor-like RCC1 family protein
VTRFFEAWCWGEGLDGQLGDGFNSPSTIPVLVSGGHNFATIDAGFNFTCATTKSDLPLCWGLNSDGQLGNGTGGSTSDPGVVGTGFSFSFVAAGGFHSCGVSSVLGTWCWGGNGSGQLGNGQDPQGSFGPMPVKLPQ